MPHLNGGEEKHDWEEKDILHHYYSYWDMPAEIQKYLSPFFRHILSNILISDFFCRYWRQRYDLFSLYDEEIRLTDSAWFGVTPEAIAQYVPFSSLFLSSPLSLSSFFVYNLTCTVAKSRNIST